MKIKFMPMNVECDVDPSKSLLQIAKENGLKIKSICNGVPSCAECRVRITSGDNSIPEPSKAELSLIGTSYFLDGRRLSCQVRCFGPVTVDLTEQLNKVDTQKKVRGFKQKDQKEISAVQDTMILSPVEAQAQVQKAAEKATEQAQQAQEKKNQPARAAQQSRPQNQNSNQNPRHGNQGQKTQNADGAKNLNQSNQQRQGQNPNAKKANHPNQNGPRNPNQNQKPQQAQQNRNQNQNQNRNSNQQQSKPDAVAKPETSGDVASLAKKPVDS